MSQFSFAVVKDFLTPIFPRLRKTQFTNLALGVFGLAESQSGLLSEIVRGFPTDYVLAVAHKHRLKRWNRFLANPHFRPETWLTAWVAWCVDRFTDKGRLLIALDWTGLPGNRMCLVAAIPFRGRAIPLYWHVVSYRTMETSQNRLEEQFIRNLLVLLPFGVTPIILADRGFGRAQFMNFLIGMKLRFVLRVKGEVYITTHKGKKRKLKTVKTRPGWIRWYPNVTYREDGIVTGVNIAATVADDGQDPWYFVTNLADKRQVVAYYTARFRIEEFFKDAKHQLGLEQLQTPHDTRVHGLLFVACVTYGLLMLVGLGLETNPVLQRCLITGGRSVASCIWLAVKTIRYGLAPEGLWQSVISFAGGP